MLHVICLVIIMQMVQELPLWQIFISVRPPSLSFTVLHQVQTVAVSKRKLNKIHVL